MNTRLLSICLIWTGILTLSGCTLGEPRGEPDVCRADCRVDINLPDEPRDLHVERGAQVNFRVHHAKGESGHTVLSFEEAAFLNEEKTALYTLELRSGNNLFTASNEDVCAAPHGCRYVVIDMERPDRPSIISSPKVIFY